MSFRLSFQPAIRERLKRLSVAVRAVGLSHQLAGPLKELVGLLETQPLEAGEPQYVFKNLGLISMLIVRKYLAFGYSVDETRRIVYVAKLTMLERNPFPAGFDRIVNEDPDAAE